MGLGIMVTHYAGEGGFVILFKIVSAPVSGKGPLSVPEWGQWLEKRLNPEVLLLLGGMDVFLSLPDFLTSAPVIDEFWMVASVPERQALTEAAGCLKTYFSEHQADKDASVWKPVIEGILSKTPDSTGINFNGFLTAVSSTENIRNAGGLVKIKLAMAVHPARCKTDDNYIEDTWTERPETEKAALFAISEDVNRFIFNNKDHSITAFLQTKTYDDFFDAIEAIVEDRKIFDMDNRMLYTELIAFVKEYADERDLQQIDGAASLVQFAIQITQPAQVLSWFNLLNSEGKKSVMRIKKALSEPLFDRVKTLKREDDRALLSFLGFLPRSDEQWAEHFLGAVPPGYRLEDVSATVNGTDMMSSLLGCTSSNDKKLREAAKKMLVSDMVKYLPPGTTGFYLKADVKGAIIYVRLNREEVYFVRSEKEKRVKTIHFTGKGEGSLSINEKVMKKGGMPELKEALKEIAVVKITILRITPAVTVKAASVKPSVPPVQEQHPEPVRKSETRPKTRKKPAFPQKQIPSATAPPHQDKTEETDGLIPSQKKEDKELQPEVPPPIRLDSSDWPAQNGQLLELEIPSDGSCLLWAVMEGLGIQSIEKAVCRRMEDFRGYLSETISIKYPEQVITYLTGTIHDGNFTGIPELLRKPFEQFYSLLSALSQIKTDQPETEEVLPVVLKIIGLLGSGSMAPLSGLLSGNTVDKATLLTTVNKMVEDYVRTRGIPDYLAAMYSERTWGGDLELSVICKELGLCMRVYEKGRPYKEIGDASLPAIYLGYNGSHYTLLIPQVFERHPALKNFKVIDTWTLDQTGHTALAPVLTVPETPFSFELSLSEQLPLGVIVTSVTDTLMSDNPSVFKPLFEGMAFNTVPDFLLRPLYDMLKTLKMTLLTGEMVQQLKKEIALLRARLVLMHLEGMAAEGIPETLYEQLKTVHLLAVKSGTTEALLSSPELVTEPVFPGTDTPFSKEEVTSKGPQLKDLSQVELHHLLVDALIGYQKENPSRILALFHYIAFNPENFNNEIVRVLKAEELSIISMISYYDTALKSTGFFIPPNTIRKYAQLIMYLNMMKTIGKQIESLKSQSGTLPETFLAFEKFVQVSFDTLKASVEKEGRVLLYEALGQCRDKGWKIELIPQFLTGYLSDYSPPEDLARRCLEDFIGEKITALPELFKSAAYGLLVADIRNRTLSVGDKPHVLRFLQIDTERLPVSRQEPDFSDMMVFFFDEIASAGIFSNLPSFKIGETEYQIRYLKQGEKRLFVGQSKDQPFIFLLYHNESHVSQTSGSWSITYANMLETVLKQLRSQRKITEYKRV